MINKPGVYTLAEAVYYNKVIPAFRHIGELHSNDMINGRVWKYSNGWLAIPGIHFQYPAQFYCPIIVHDP